MPIVYRERHHDHAEIRRYYRAADFCMVTSLHDGMNLVAKEYVAARDDDEGALILSRFTGASRELRDAYLVNPYDVEDMAPAHLHEVLIVGCVRAPLPHGAHARRRCASTTSIGWAGAAPGRAGEDSPARVSARPRLSVVDVTGVRATLRSSPARNS